MCNIFWGLTIVTIIYLIFLMVLRKDYFSLNTYIILGIYLPMFLSEFNWSFLHISNKPDNYYLLFCVFDIFLIFINFLPQSGLHPKDIQFKKNVKAKPIEIYNVLYLMFILIENYYASGHFFPSRYGIDIHTARMPYIYAFTTAIYLISVMNLIEFFVTKKIKYIFYIIFLMAFNIITKSARIDSFICAVQLLSMILFYFIYSKKTVKKRDKIIKKKKSKTKIIVIVGIISIIILNVGINVGINRMNSKGKYHLSYAKDGLNYKGPSIGNTEIIAYYYGYFPLSYDNLAYNMMYSTIRPNYIGLSSFRTLYFGVLQFDNFFGLDGGEATKANVIRSQAAAVATGFWVFYYDFGDLFFIPLFISFIIYYILKRNITKKNPSALSFVLYFYWIPLWTFLSFDNRIFDYQVLLHIILMIIIIPNRYTLNTSIEDEKINEGERKKIELK